MCVLSSQKLSQRSAQKKTSLDSGLTPLTCSSPVSCPSAVTDKAVPAILTDGIVLARVAVTLLGVDSDAGRFDASSVLLLCQLPDVLAPPINEKVSDAAHVAIVQHGCPEFSREDETRSVFWQSSKVHIPF